MHPTHSHVRRTIAKAAVALAVSTALVTGSAGVTQTALAMIDEPDRTHHTIRDHQIRAQLAGTQTSGPQIR